MAKWRLKGCPRCRGDVRVERAEDRWDEYCLQCGYRRELKIVQSVLPPTPVENKELAE